MEIGAKKGQYFLLYLFPFPFLMLLWTLTVGCHNRGDMRWLSQLWSTDLGETGLLSGMGLLCLVDETCIYIVVFFFIYIYNISLVGHKSWTRAKLPLLEWATEQYGCQNSSSSYCLTGLLDSGVFFYCRGKKYIFVFNDYFWFTVFKLLWSFHILIACIIIIINLQKFPL